jgi:hypothetical protein
MTNVVSADDLKFANVRARWLDSPRQVAADLLAAAARPELRDGVSALQARVKAGSLLADFGERDDAIDILRSAAAGSRPGADEDARLMLAISLAQAGDVSEAEKVARESIAAEAAGPQSKMAFSQFMFVAMGFVDAGLPDLALRWADEGVAAASEVRGSRSLKFRAAQIAASLREGVCVRLQAVQEFGQLRSTNASFSDPAWPAVAQGRLLWWPENQYGRLARQVPVLGEVLGRSWQDHTRVVESALRDSARWSPGEPTGQKVDLVAGDFDNFTSFLESRSADPRDRAAMTAYGLEESKTPVVAWPGKPRKPCWCGSGRRYQDCCGTAGHLRI